MLQRRFLSSLKASTATYLHPKLDTHLKVLGKDKMCTIFAQQIESVISDKNADTTFNTSTSIPYDESSIMKMRKSPIILDLPTMERGFLTGDLYTLIILLFHLRFARDDGNPRPLAMLRVSSERKPAIDRVLRNFKEMYPQASLPQVHVYEDDRIQKGNILDFFCNEDYTYSVADVQQQMKDMMAHPKAEKMGPMLGGQRLSDVMRRAITVLEWEKFPQFSTKILNSDDNFFILHMAVTRGNIRNPTIISPGRLPKKLVRNENPLFSWLECSPWHLDQLAEMLVRQLDMALRYLTTLTEDERNDVMQIRSNDITPNSGWIELTHNLVNLLGRVESISREDILFTRKFMHTSGGALQQVFVEQTTRHQMERLDKCLPVVEIEYKEDMPLADVIKSIHSKISAAHKPMFEILINEVLECGYVLINGVRRPVQNSIERLDIAEGRTLLGIRCSVSRATAGHSLPRIQYMIKWTSS